MKTEVDTKMTLRYTGTVSFRFSSSGCGAAVPSLTIREAAASTGMAAMAARPSAASDKPGHTVMSDAGGLGRVEVAQKPPARRAKPRRRSSIQAFLMRAKGEKGGDLSGTAYEGLDAADILAKQSDMLEQIQHIMIEERWQHEQHTRVLENELQSLHDIIRQHEESEVGVRPPPHPPRSSADPVCESPSRMLSSQALTPRPPPLLPISRRAS